MAIEMTFGELKSEIFNLNFEKANEYDGDENLIPQAINRAVSVITTEVRPVIGSFEISGASSQSARENEQVFSKKREKYNLKELSITDGHVAFLSLISIENADGEEIFSYEIHQNQTIYFDKGFSDFPVTVFYKKCSQRVNSQTSDDTEIDLDSDVTVLLPLLSAYFIWHDDDRARAQEFYTQYEVRRDGILYNQRKMAATVITSDFCRGGFFL